MGQFMEWPAPPSGIVGLPAAQEEELDMTLAAISVLGVDLGKNVCSIVGLNSSGAVVMRRKVRRETLIGLAEKLPACLVAMEACCGARHVGRIFATAGHDVRLMSADMSALMSRHTRTTIATPKGSRKQRRGLRCASSN